jgi:hypothetical protein
MWLAWLPDIIASTSTHYASSPQPCLVGHTRLTVSINQSISSSVCIIPSLICTPALIVPTSTCLAVTPISGVPVAQTRCQPPSRALTVPLSSRTGGRSDAHIFEVSASRLEWLSCCLHFSRSVDSLILKANANDISGPEDRSRRDSVRW